MITVRLALLALMGIALSSSLIAADGRASAVAQAGGKPTITVRDHTNQRWDGVIEPAIAD
jgi:hypothetical protein